MEKFTLNQFKALYPDDNACLDKIFQLRFGHLKECPNPKCKQNFQYYRVKSVSKVNKAQRKCYECANCGYQIYPLAGTPLHKIRVPLTYIFMVCFLQTTTRNGVSAKEIQRVTGVTYKCAHAMGMRVRQLMTANKPTFIEGGIVELDEKVITADKAKMNSKVRANVTTKTKDKIILAVVQRQGDIITKVVNDTQNKTIKPFLEESVGKNTTIFTDDATKYRYMVKGYKDHDSVNHSAREYVRGNVHNNTIEGFFSQVERTVSTHVHVSKKYLQRYVDECAWRYMKRNSQHLMFDSILQNLSLFA